MAHARNDCTDMLQSCFKPNTYVRSNTKSKSITLRMSTHSHSLTLRVSPHLLQLPAAPLRGHRA
jgi:hypothetical protein